METLILFSREILGTSEYDLQVVGWCDVRWKVLWQRLSIGDVANFFVSLFANIIVWQQRQHLNASFMKIRKKKTRPRDCPSVRKTQ